MTTVGLQPISLRNATLTVAEDDYSHSVGEVIFVPQVEYDWIGTLDGHRIPMFVRVRWVVVLGYAQDFATPGSLSLYLIEHAAQTRTITFLPQGTGQRSVTADVMVIPGQLGGTPGQILTATVVLPLFDDPIIGEAT